jgi:UDP-N-acetylmuramoylalanine--D-glutamate ligase
LKDTQQFMGKKILVLGLAKSGFAAAKLLHSLGAKVTVNDAAPEDGNEQVTALRSIGVQVISGGHPDDILETGFQLIVKNPGIPYRNKVLSEAMEKGIPIWTEIEISYRISEAPILAITGSNGKTTTTTLLFEMLAKGHKSPLIAGNIGTVSCEIAEEAKENELIVLEASSFQLMGTETFRPSIAIWTNVYDSHLDYHGTTEAYIEAKFGITKNQTDSDFFIYNADQAALEEVANKTKAIGIPFSTNGRKTIGISADESQIYWNGEPYLPLDCILLPGKHNLENILCAMAAAILSGCQVESIQSVLETFTGVAHRMQFVKEVEQRKFFNDSKATNTLATKSALAAFEKPIILIGGGLDRGHSFEELRPHMNHVKAVISIGETAEKLREFSKSCQVEKVVIAGTMEEAVEQAYSLSEVGDIILLSPACASWDQYPNFEIRGEAFIQAVHKL